MGQPEGAGSGKRHAGSRRGVLARPSGRLYGTAMRVPGPRFISPCLPSPCQKAPIGSAWVHEIKHDGYRLMARRDGNRVRLFTRRGYDWSDKYPRIVDSLLSLRVKSIIVDGEAVWAGKDGKSDFDRLHSRAHDEVVFLCQRRSKIAAACRSKNASMAGFGAS
jgi:bifunctional non-homologous end joining protein LigD